MTYQRDSDITLIRQVEAMSARLTKRHAASRDLSETVIRESIKKLGALFIHFTDLAQHLMEINDRAGIIETEPSTKQSPEMEGQRTRIKKTLLISLEWLVLLITDSLNKRLHQKYNERKRIDNRHYTQLHKRIQKRVTSMEQLLTLHKLIAAQCQEHEPVTLFADNTWRTSLRQAKASCAIDTEHQALIQRHQKTLNRSERVAWGITLAATAGALLTGVIVLNLGYQATHTLSLLGFITHARVTLCLLLPLVVIALAGFVVAPIVRRERLKYSRDRFAFLINNQTMLNRLENEFTDPFDDGGYCPSNGSQSD